MNSLHSTFTTINNGVSNTEPILLWRGVKQGDPLSPMLFNLVLDNLLTTMNTGTQGGSVSHTAKINIIAFVDDLVILQDDPIKLVANLAEVSNYVETRGMSINPAKCAALV